MPKANLLGTGIDMYLSTYQWEPVINYMGGGGGGGGGGWKKREGSGIFNSCMKKGGKDFCIL